MEIAVVAAKKPIKQASNIAAEIRVAGETAFGNRVTLGSLRI
jgi:hypothetical protein